jgi:hypothetical protein
MTVAFAGSSLPARPPGSWHRQRHLAVEILARDLHRYSGNSPGVAVKASSSVADSAASCSGLSRCSFGHARLDDHKEATSSAVHGDRNRSQPIVRNPGGLGLELGTEA